MKSSYFLFVLFGFCCCCKSSDNPKVADFATTPVSYPLNPQNYLTEASGLVNSIKQPTFLWSHEDAGSESNLYLLTNQGKIIGKYKLPIQNYDWEDLAIGVGPTLNETYLYLADIGANDNNRGERTIYRFPEPKDINTATDLKNIDFLKFKLPDTGFDTETMILDPLTKDIFVATKNLANAIVYRLAYPQKISNSIVTANNLPTAEKVGEMTVGYDLTGGAISPDGKEIIIRGYSAIYYWKRADNETVGKALLRKPDRNLPYKIEPQGEAVCFDNNGKGYYNLSEIGKSESVSLYYYGRE